MKIQWAKFNETSVTKIAIGYSLIAWILVLIFSALLPILGTPLWVLQTITVFFLLGLPITLLIGWAAPGRQVLGVLETFEFIVYEWDGNTRDFKYKSFGQRFEKSESKVQKLQRPSSSIDYKDRVHPDDIDRYQKAFVNFIKGPETHMEHEYRRIDQTTGEFRWIRDRGVAHRDEKNGKVIKIIGIQEDINEQKTKSDMLTKTNERLTNAINKIPAPIALWDKEEKLIFPNLAYREMHGYQKKSDITGISYRDLILGAAKNGIYPIGNLEIQEFVEDRVIQNRRKDQNGTRELELSNGTTYLIFDTELPSGELISFFADVSEQKNKERDLAISMDEAKEANLAKSKFLANMSHELRTPLNAIIGYGELLLEEAEEEGMDSICEDLRRITDSGAHLLNLINDILDISKIEAGRLELFNTDFKLGQVLSSLESVTRPLAEKNSNEVIFETPENLGSMHSDETRLRQSLLNLISNACKFTENGTIKITVTPNDVSGLIQFSVADTGIGLSEAQMSKIFENFTQADADTTAKFGGTGLGLSITKTLIEMMGGSLDVKSTLGKGSTFTISVPMDLRKRAKQSELEPELIKSNYNKEIGTPFYGSDILIIDDDILIHDLIKRKLHDQPFRIHSALDGDSGIDKAHEIHPKLILLDVLMPGKDGWSVIAELRATPSLAAIPIVVISTLDDDLSAKALGARSYVQKPIDKSLLLESIRDIFTGSPEGKQALIIDDDPDASKIASRLLREIGFEVEMARNGLEGLNRLSEKHDLIILDLSMPVMDGFEFLAKINNTPLKNLPPIIVYSAMLLDETMKVKLAKMSAGIIDKNQIGSHEDLSNLIEASLNSQVLEKYV